VLFSPLRYKVLLAIDNLPAHVWSPKIVQAIIDSFCLGFEITLASLNREDLSRFFVVTWSIHLNLISMEISCIVSEPEEQCIEGALPLFLLASDTIHSK
jgi:hypothetical protein